MEDPVVVVPMAEVVSSTKGHVSMADDDDANRRNLVEVLDPANLAVHGLASLDSIVHRVSVDCLDSTRFVEMVVEIAATCSFDLLEAPM